MLTYLEDQGVLAACGSIEKDDQSCYQLRPDQPSGWQALVAGQLINHHCPSPQTTRNHFLREVGWFLIGEEEEDGRLCGGGIGATISTELLNSQLQWTKLPIDSPYGSAGYPYKTCSVAINSSTVIVSGGWNGDGRLSSTWMLDLTDFTWTKLQDMPGPRSGHGCTITATGELIIAGGYDDDSIGTLLSVYIYNLVSDTWSRMGDLPAGMVHHGYPIMFLWNKNPIITESYSSNIWMLDGTNWEKVEATLGSVFNGKWDTATTVPTGVFSC